MRILLIAERTDHEDGSRDLIVEVNDIDGPNQYSRTPFHFESDVTNAEAEAEILSEMSGYLSEEDAIDISW